MDFTIELYQKFIEALRNGGYQFQSFQDFIKKPLDKVVILRHDIDKRKYKALVFAELEYKLDIRATYYFRILPVSYNENLIKQIANMNHEIGYHYEDLSLGNGNFQKAIKSFKMNLANLRRIYPVKTICMHGRSLSKYDNRTLWNKYDYKKYGIIGEPYFDLDFRKVLYITDTGQCWNGERFSVRDKVVHSHNLSFNSTFDIIKSIDILPEQIMITTHPNRWAASLLEWSWINGKMIIKRQVKRFLLKNRIER
jgi:hypothetical protein